MFGLEPEEISQMQHIFAKYPQICQVAVFGSRAKGNYNPWSDIDLAIFGNSIGLDVINGLDNELDDLMLPIYVDLLVVNQVENEAIKTQIHRDGKILYQANGIVV